MKTRYLLWAIFLALLAVLLPHTAWMFSQFEAPGGMGIASAWAAAVAFEASIAVLTHRLARHWEAQPKRLSGGAKWRYRWANAYAGGLLIALVVSSLANLAHSVEFGRSLAIFAAWGIPAAVYQVATGAILPLVSLLFARVLSYEVDTEDAPDPALADLRSQLADLRRRLAEAEAARRRAEEKFDAAGELLVALTSAEKRARIQAAARQWPQLKPAAIAVISGASESYVSEVLSQEVVA